MAFKIKTVRTGQEKVFSVKEILEFLGEKVNDEILIQGKTYRISSFEEITSDNGGSSSTWQSQSYTVNKDAQTQFPFADSFTSTDSLFLTVNHVLYSYGNDKDFHIEDHLLHWHGAFDLEQADQVEIKYLKTI